MQNFVKELAPWVRISQLLSTALANAMVKFDVTDPSYHFQIVVPERALRSEVVLNAIFAISALHLNRTSQRDALQVSGTSADAFLADVYHTKCIGMLIALINEEASVTNDDVLVAAVILRKFEEMHG